jgi:hypothetical protein
MSVPQLHKWAEFLRYEWVVAAEARKQEDSSKLEEYSKHAISLRSAEEYKKSACEDSTCDLTSLCVL